MPVDKKRVIFIVGPTAIGKTAVALKMARRMDAEIISCDSMQVYKGMDILSQAPVSTQTRGVKYHLVRFLSPQDNYNVAAFIKKALPLIEDIIERNKVPIIVGGSGLYVKGLIDGLFPSPKPHTLFRKKMYAYAARYGSKRLHAKLKKIDPDAAGLIHPNDTRRIVRALEIWHSTGRTMTELKGDTKGIAGKYDIKIFGLTAAREEVYSRINARVDKMFAAGAVDEVKKLSKKKLSVTAKSVLGLKEISGYLKGDYTLGEAKELVKRNTRRFAKRQFTWFRADKRIKWIKEWKELLQ